MTFNNHTIYQADPSDFYTQEEIQKRFPCGPYWSKNWTFMYDGNKMIDTYYGESSIVVTEENKSLFHHVVDLDHYEKYGGQLEFITSKYSKDDYVIIPADSRGRNNPICFVRNGAKPDGEVEAHYISGKILDEAAEINAYVHYYNAIADRKLEMAVLDVEKLKRLLTEQIDKDTAQEIINLCVVEDTQ